MKEGQATRELPINNELQSLVNAACRILPCDCTLPRAADGDEEQPYVLSPSPQA